MQMSLSIDDIQKALRIRRAVNEHFEKEGRKKVLAKEIMNLFVSKGIFTGDHKEGFPIRDFLNSLEKAGQLKLIPQAFFEPKDQNKNWYFIKPNKQ